MYAVIKTGGKQYRVSEGDVIEIEKLDVAVGETVAFDQVLMTKSDAELAVGAPYLDRAKVTGEVLDQTRGAKVDVLKFQRRKRVLKRRGHRQDYTQVRITQIS